MGMATRTIYLIRHGQHIHVARADGNEGWSAERAFDDEIVRQQDGGLTTIGRKQAELTAARFRAQPIHVIHTSTLPRAVETATSIATALPNTPVATERGLWECVPHVPAKLAHRAKEFPPALLERDQAHAIAAFERYFHPSDSDNQQEIIVCHGNLIRYFICRVLEVTPDAWINMYTYNCGVSEVQIQPEGECILISFNEMGHLPTDLRTFEARRA